MAKPEPDYSRTYPSQRGISVIPRRFKLVFGLLLALSGSHFLLAATQPGGYTPAPEKDIYPAGEQAPSGIGRSATAGGRLQLASTLGEDVPLWLEQAWQKNPQDLEVGLLLLRHYLKQQDNTRALALARQLYADHPDNPKVLKALALTLLANGNADAALEYANKLTELQPDSADTWYLLGVVYTKKRDNAAAHQALERAVALDPAHSLLPLEAQARLYLSEQKYKDVLDIARTIQNRFPTLPIGYQLEGDGYSQHREFAKAAAAFQAAFRKAPSTALVLALADAQWQVDDQTAAIQTLEGWLGNNPKDIQARTQLLMYFASSQRQTEAISEGETILKQEPDNGIALNNLAALYQQTGDKRALQFAERAMQLVPDSPDVADTLGWILVQSNQLQRGLELLRQAVTQKPDDPMIGYHLAAAFAKTGQREAALQQLSIVAQLANLSPTRLPPGFMTDVKKLQESLQQK